MRADTCALICTQMQAEWPNRISCAAFNTRASVVGEGTSELQFSDYQILHIP